MLVLQEVVAVRLALLEGRPVVVVVAGVGGGEGGAGEVGRGGRLHDAAHPSHRLLLHRLPLPRLHNVLPQLGGSIPPMDLEVESTGVADGDVFLDPPPQCGRRGRAVGACCTLRPRLA